MNVGRFREPVHLIAAIPENGATKIMIHQLRIYEIFEHNKAAFHGRFRELFIESDVGVVKADPHLPCVLAPHHPSSISNVSRACSTAAPSSPARCKYPSTDP